MYVCCYAVCIDVFFGNGVRTGLCMGMGEGMGMGRGVRVGVGMGVGVKGGCGYGWDERCDECRWCGLLRFSFCFVKKGLPIAEIFHALPDGQDLQPDFPVHELSPIVPP